MQELFFLMIRQRLRTLVPAIKWFDLYRGQFEPGDDGDTMPAHRPCVFFEFGVETAQTVGLKISRVTQPFAIYVVTDTTKNWSKETANDAFVAKELGDHFTIANAVKAALIGYKGGEFIAGKQALYNSAIIRTGGKAANVKGNHIFTMIEFLTTLTDDAAASNTTGTIDTLTINVNPAP